MIQPLFHQDDGDAPAASDNRNTKNVRNSSDVRQSSMPINETLDNALLSGDRPITEADTRPAEQGRLYHLDDPENAEIEMLDPQEALPDRESTLHDESQSFLAEPSVGSKALQILGHSAKSLSEDVNPLLPSVDLPTGSNEGALPLKVSSLSIDSQSRNAISRAKEQSGRREERGLKRKIATTAMAVAMLPVLAVGTATYFSGRLIFDDLVFKADSAVTPQEMETTQRQHLDLFALLLIGTGVSAIVAGAIARFWALRALYVAMRSGKVAAERRFLEQRDRTTQMLTEAIAQIQAAVGQNDVLRVSAAIVRDAIDCDRVLIYQTDNALEAKVVAESANLSLPSLLGTGIKNPSFVAHYIESDDEVIRVIDDAAASHAEIGGHGARAILSTPLKMQEKRCFMVAHRCDAHDWQQQQVSIFRHLAAQANVALEQVALKTEQDRLQVQLRTEIQWRNFFEEATRFIHESMTEEEVLKTSVEETRRVLSCDRVVIYSLDGASQGVIIAESVAPGCMRVLGKTIEDPCFETRYLALYADGRVRTIENIDEADLTPCYADQLKQLAVRASIVAPILHSGKVLGLLVAHQCSGPRNWLNTEVKWFSQLAEQVGYALDNAKFKQQAERLAQSGYREPSSTEHQEAVRLLRNGQTALESLLTESSSRSNAIVELVDQVQSLTDTSRTIVAKAEQAALESQQLAQGMRDGHRRVDQTVDINTEIQETVARAAAKGQQLSHSTRQISQMMAQIQDWSSQMSQTAIKLSIVSGQTGGKDQGAVVSIAEAALSFTQKIAGATAQLGPLVAAVEADTQAIANDMEIGTEQLIVGAELTQETRHRLNQLTVNGDKLGLLLNQMVEVAPSQSQVVTSTYRQIQEISQLMNYTLEKTAELSDLMSDLETVVQTN